MTVNLTGSRPRQQTAQSLPVALIAEPPIENDTDNTMRFRIARDNFTPAPFTLTVAAVSGSNQIAATDLSKLRKGDAIASTEITGTITAIDLSVTPHAATVSANASASGAAELAITPATIDLGLYELVVTHQLSANSSVVGVTVEVHTFDGSKANNADGSGKDNVVADSTNLLPGQRLGFSLNLDQVFTAARLPRST